MTVALLTPVFPRCPSAPLEGRGRGHKALAHSASDRASGSRKQPGGAGPRSPGQRPGGGSESAWPGPPPASHTSTEETAGDRGGRGSPSAPFSNRSRSREPPYSANHLPRASRGLCSGARKRKEPSDAGRSLRSEAPSAPEASGCPRRPRPSLQHVEHGPRSIWKLW